MKIALDDFAIMPTRAHETDAGLDIYSPVDAYLCAYDMILIDTGLHVEIPEGYVGLITSKSGLMCKSHLTTRGTIDCGYTGSIKRWNHHTLCSTHGVGPIHREVGSMGANSSPSRVFKNKKMAGQYGNEQVTIQNLTVVKIDAERNLIAIKGAVPGNKNGIVFIRDSVKA